MKKHVLALFLVALVALPAQQTRACGGIEWVVGAIVVSIVGMSVSAGFWSKFEGNEYVKGYACPEYGRPITWYCCTANAYNQLNCNPLTIPCQQSTAMCYYGNYYGREHWAYAGKIYTDDAAAKIAGLTASTLIFAVSTVGITVGLCMCLI